MTTNNLRVAAVPEAYNDPFPNADFVSHGLHSSPTLTYYTGGSGAMLEAVLTKEVDAAFALTDCIVAAIENGSPLALAGPLIHTPLTWAVIVAPGGKTSPEELHSATWGISRLGSGSHVMVQTLAKERRWSTEPKFVVCGDFASLRAAVREGRVDAFLWEHYTTKPYADQGEVSIIGGVPTPWGCFSVVVRRDSPRIKEVHSMIDAFVEAGLQFVQNDSTPAAVAKKYGMTADDAKAWVGGVQYAGVGERHVKKEVLELTRKTLHNSGVIAEFLCEGGTDSYHV